MASNNQAIASPTGRKVRWLAGAITLVIAFYCAGWFYAAHRLDGFVNTILTQGFNTDLRADCQGMAVGGFPFLIGVSCDQTSLFDDAQGIRGSFGALRSAARIYMPGTAIVEIDGPADIQTAAGIGISGDWKALRASVSANLGGVQRASLEGRDLAAKLVSAVSFQAFDLDIGHFELHFRANGNDLETAFITEVVRFAQEGVSPTLPKFSASVDLSLLAKGQILAGLPYGSKKAVGQLRALKVDMGRGIYGELSGPFTIDEEGWISGEMTLTLENLDLWEKTLVSTFPDAAPTLSSIAELLRGLSRGKARTSVKLSVVRGTILLSLLPIGQIPQI